MNVGEWTAVLGLVISVLAAVYASTKVIVRSMMSELSPNGGQSMKDQINRIDQRVDRLYTILAFDAPRHAEIVDKVGE
jgi:C4-dicarboxylate-specific signal transduction histidine kinase